MNAPFARYTRTAILLHWLIALLIMTNVVLVWTVDLFPESMGRPIINTHKSIGITVFGLALMRLLWRATHRPPQLPENYPRWEKWSAHAAHAALYLLIFMMPLTGWLHDSAWKDADTHPLRLFGLMPFPHYGPFTQLDAAHKESMHSLFGLLHTSFAYVLYAVFALHVIGALKHQFIDKEKELQRMLP